MSQSGASTAEREHVLENAHPGPVINGRATTCAFLPTEMLSSSPHLPNLVLLINAAYAQASDRGYEPADYKRLYSTQQLIAELRSQARVLIMLFSEPRDGDEFPGGLIGTGVNYPMATYDDREMEEMTANLDPVDAKFFRLDHGAKPIPGTRTWGLTFMAVAPTCSRRGVASAILKVLEKDIREQSQLVIREDLAASKSVQPPLPNTMHGLMKPGAGQSRNRIRIATRGELNEPFYTKRGFETKDSIQIPAGAEGIGGRNLFHVVAMEKVLS